MIYKKPSGAEQGKSDTPATQAEVRLLIVELEEKIETLRIQYEQFFSGLLKLPPDKLNQTVQRELREMQRAPLRNSALNFKIRAVKTRYQTLATYWQRVFQARDAGTYSKDVFKANLREQAQYEEQRAQTGAGKTERAFKELFQSYQSALEQATGKAQKLDYSTFQKTILQRSRELKQKSGGKKVSFKVVVKDGKVTLQAVAQ